MFVHTIVCNRWHAHKYINKTIWAHFPTPLIKYATSETSWVINATTMGCAIWGLFLHLDEFSTLFWTCLCVYLCVLSHTEAAESHKLLTVGYLTLEVTGRHLSQMSQLPWPAPPMWGSSSSTSPHQMTALCTRSLSVLLVISHSTFFPQDCKLGFKKTKQSMLACCC